MPLVMTTMKRRRRTMEHWKDDYWQMENGVLTK
jgi:hypothetical protein